ncbi:DUF5640 domain-containing protein [Streptomyces sp. NPDC001820]|uniref:DUF5640 domain-containing protein n=1 Tax=Streptomyces sp. NPDC001820 TaxID=3364613 RepID=UPI0036A41E65
MLVPTVALCALLTLAGCGGGGADGTSAGLGVSADDGPADQGAAIPAALIGSWSGGISDGFRSSVYSFNGDGSYSMDIKGVRITGRFSVSGNQLTTYPDVGPGRTYQWGIGQDGYLYLDGESYVPFN